MHYSPCKVDSNCSMSGVGWFRSKVYIDMTIPGLQNPHWDPWAFAILSWRVIMVKFRYTLHANNKNILNRQIKH